MENNNFIKLTRGIKDFFSFLKSLTWIFIAGHFHVLVMDIGEIELFCRDERTLAVKWFSAPDAVFTVRYRSTVTQEWTSLPEVITFILMKVLQIHVDTFVKCGENLKLLNHSYSNIFHAMTSWLGMSSGSYCLLQNYCLVSN